MQCKTSAQYGCLPGRIADNHVAVVALVADDGLEGDGGEEGVAVLGVARQPALHRLADRQLRLNGPLLTRCGTMIDLA